MEILVLDVLVSVLLQGTQENFVKCWLYVIMAMKTKLA